MVENNPGNAPETCKAKWSELVAGISAHPSLPHKLVQNNGGDSGPNGGPNGGPHGRFRGPGNLDASIYVFKYFDFRISPENYENVKTSFKICSYIQKMTLNLLETLKTSIYNTEHTKT